MGLTSLHEFVSLLGMSTDLTGHTGTCTVNGHDLAAATVVALPACNPANDHNLTATPGLAFHHAHRSMALLEAGSLVIPHSLPLTEHGTVAKGAFIPPHAEPLEQRMCAVISNLVLGLDNNAGAWMHVCVVVCVALNNACILKGGVGAHALACLRMTGATRASCFRLCHAHPYFFWQLLPESPAHPGRHMLILAPAT